MKIVYIVQASWDEDARVWCAEGVNFIGLATSAESLDALFKKVPIIIEDLLGANDDLADGDIPLRLLIDGAIAGRHCAH